MAKKKNTADGDELVKSLKDTEADDDGDEREDEGSPDAEGEEAAEADDTGKQKRNGKKNGKGGKNKAEAKEDAQPSTVKKPADDKSRRKKKLLIWISIGAGIVLIGAAAAGYWLFGRPETTNTNATVNTNSDATSELVPRKIDGVLDTAENQNKYPVAIMVENSVAARPQSGLDRANIVFEALAEGGITRFMAIYTFAGDSVKEIGPVRSARPYYVDWARAYNAMYVHIGGSPKALSRISSTGIFDFNQFYNSQYFWRDKTRDVATEHTLYTSSHLMTLALLDKSAPTTGDYTAWTYKNEAASAERASSQHLTINFSSFSYKVDYEYDPVENVYVRSVAEKLHVMRDGTQLKPKNVVVLTVNRRLETPVDGNHGRLEMDTIGQGNAKVFLDGTVIEGTWKKDSSSAPLQLFAGDGSEIALNAGQTFVEIVPPDQTVTVQ